MSEVVNVTGEVIEEETTEVTGEQIIQEADGQMALAETVSNDSETNAALSNFFSDIDFASLSGAIQKMADNNTQLTEKEKEMSLGIIDQWERDVIDAIDEKRTESNKYVNTLSISCNDIYIPDEEFEMIVAATHTEDLYKKYLDLKEKAVDVANEQPESYQEDLSDTVEDVIRKRQDNELAYQRHNIKLRKANNERDNALLNLKKEMNGNDLVKDFIKKAGRYDRNITKFKKQCREKSQLAKISVSISNDEVQKALKDMLSFSVKI
jgi:hypothetical protein